MGMHVRHFVSVAELLFMSETIEGLREERDALRAALQRILEYPVHSEPVGGAYAMQDIAFKALNWKCEKILDAVFTPLERNNETGKPGD